MPVYAAPLIHRPRADLPVLLSVPHSGRDYPPAVVAAARRGRPALTALEDPLVDRLAWRALRRGFGAVIARTPRAVIDCNRSERDADPALIAGAPRGPLSARARGGLGIVPARSPAHGHLWNRPVTLADFEARLNEAHRPYHRAVEEMLGKLKTEFGCALLIDCHSMPPGVGLPALIVGDLHGRSAERWLGTEALAIARAHGVAGRLNDPYAGGHVVDRHGRPGRGIHALQVEIDRSAYLDGALRDPGPGFDSVARLIEALAAGLGEALLGRRQAIAAE